MGKNGSRQEGCRGHDAEAHHRSHDRGSHYRCSDHRGSGYRSGYPGSHRSPKKGSRSGEERNQKSQTTPAPKTDAEKVYAAAKEAVAKCTNDSMTKEQKLRAAFDYLKNNYIEGIRRNDYREMDWPVVYGKDLLIDGKGDCFSYGAAFAYMAKIIGCSDCYACNSGGHGWAEVEGKIYDPEWSRHSSNYSYFGMSYDEPCDVGYKGAIGSASWMHVAV